MPSWIVPPQDGAALTVKDFLKRYAGVSLTLWRKIKRDDACFVNGARVNPAAASVRAGDEVSYALRRTTNIEAVESSLSISYEDDYLLVADKPAGQLTHPTTKERKATLANAVMHYYASSRQPHDFHPVHRLDKNTSGLVIIAKLPQVQQKLSLSGHQNLKRIYRAVVLGIPNPRAGTIDKPIARKPGSIIERIVSPDGQEAITHYRTIRAANRCCLLELELETGRTHQIRTHLSHIGHPILGDDLYGGPPAGIERQALHAGRLEFVHPIDGKLMQIHSPMPIMLENLLDTF